MSGAVAYSTSKLSKVLAIRLYLRLSANGKCGKISESARFTRTEADFLCTYRNLYRTHGTGA